MLLLLGMLGCAHTLADLDETYVTESFVSRRWLSFVQDGVVSKDEVIRQLGQPTAIFEGGRILGYRLLLVEKELPEKKHKGYMRPDPRYFRFVEVSNQRRKQLAELDQLLVMRPEYEPSLYWQIVGREAEYSLVLVFNENGILQSHRLQRVKP
jgi:hypothetical protein